MSAHLVVECDACEATVACETVPREWWALEVMRDDGAGVRIDSRHACSSECAAVVMSREPAPAIRLTIRGGER